MKHLGDFDTAVTVYGKFTTYRPSTGAAYTLGGTPAVSVYKDGSATQSTAGVTLTADFDSVTGLNHVAIDTSADGTFYSAGSHFEVVITTGTVDSVSVVGAVVMSFSLRKSSALKPTTAGRTLDVSAGGEAGIDWANIGNPTTAVNLSGTNIDVDQVVASVSGAVGSVTGNVGGNVTGSVGSVTGITASDVGAIKAKTDNLPSDPADESLIIAATDAIVTLIGSPAGASVSADIAAAKADTGSIKTTTDKLDGTVELTSDGYVFTTVALANGPSGTGGGATASEIADEVQTRTIAAVTVVNGLAANVITAAATAADFTTEIQTGLATSAALGSVASDVTAIKASTDNLPSDPADQSLVIAATTAIYDRIGAPAGASVSADVAAVKSDSAAILADTGTDGVVVAAASKTGYRLSSTGVDDVLRTAMTEGYATDGSAFTLEQAMFMIWSLLAERSIASTTLTTKKLDGTTDAMTFTLNDADAPTSQTRAT